MQTPRHKDLNMFGHSELPWWTRTALLRFFNQGLFAAGYPSNCTGYAGEDSCVVTAIKVITKQTGTRRVHGRSRCREPQSFWSEPRKLVLSAPCDLSVSWNREIGLICEPKVRTLHQIQTSTSSAVEIFWLKNRAWFFQFSSIFSYIGYSYKFIYLYIYMYIKLTNACI